MTYHRFVTRVARPKGATYGTGTGYLSEAPLFTRYLGGRVARSLIFCVNFFRLSFILLSFFPLYYMYFFELRLLINLLVSPNFSS